MNDESRFIEREKLSEGTYGIIYKAKDTKTGNSVALKIMKLEKENNGIPQTALREISILKTLDHPNILKLIDVYYKKNSLMIATEYVQYDLGKYINSTKNHIPGKLIRSYAFQMLCGIYQMHSHRIMHRDLKPENILIDSLGGLKICDFGLSRYFSVPLKKYTPGVVSEWYKAIELLDSNHSYDISIDIWSIGCIIAEMSRKKPLFKGDTDIDQLHKIVDILGSPQEDDLCYFPHNYKVDKNIPPKDLRSILETKNDYLVDLVSKMLRYNPNKRITVISALKHPYFNKIPDLIRQKSWPKEISLPDNLTLS